MGRQVGRFRLLFSVARGGMGEVFVGALPSVGFSSIVAIKLLTSRDRTQDELDAFVREARVSATISHKNVLSTQELGMDADEPYLVMPFVRGVSLAAFIRALRRHGRVMDPGLAAWITTQVCEGLHAAHELKGPGGNSIGLVHRDVSPQNVLLGYDGHVWLVDFGIAKLYESARTTETGVIKGKFGYMAPEQCMGDVLDRRTDIFALGIVLYEMLTGRELYADLPPAAAMLRITTTRPEEAARVRPGVPSELSAIVQKAMFQERDGRHATALEFGQALRATLQSNMLARGDAELAQALGELFAGEHASLERRLSEGLAALPHVTTAARSAVLQDTSASVTTSGTVSSAADV